MKLKTRGVSKGRDLGIRYELLKGLSQIFGALVLHGNRSKYWESATQEFGMAFSKWRN